MGKAVAELLAETPGLKVLFKRLGMSAVFSPYIGTQEYMLAEHGLNEGSVIRTVLATVESKDSEQPNILKTERR